MPIVIRDWGTGRHVNPPFSHPYQLINQFRAEIHSIGAARDRMPRVALRHDWIRRQDLRLELIKVDLRGRFCC